MAYQKSRKGQEEKQASARLSPVTYELAWSKGAAIATGQAIALALS